MGTLFTTMLDVTLHYPEGAVNLWDLACGRVHKVVVHVQERAIPSGFLEGDYLGDEEYRERFKEWIHLIWSEKDDLIDQLKLADSAKTAMAVSVEA
jgi:hypothetical protein